MLESSAGENPSNPLVGRAATLSATRRARPGRGPSRPPPPARRSERLLGHARQHLGAARQVAEPDLDGVGDSVHVGDVELGVVGVERALHRLAL